MKRIYGNKGFWVAVALVGVMALPSLARKKKVQPAKQQTVWVDSLSPNDRKRFEYFFTEAARQHAAGNLDRKSVA